jgi:hypothetical protein
VVEVVVEEDIILSVIEVVVVEVAEILSIMEEV